MQIGVPFRGSNLLPSYLLPYNPPSQLISTQNLIAPLRLHTSANPSLSKHLPLSPFGPSSSLAVVLAAGCNLSPSQPSSPSFVRCPLSALDRLPFLLSLLRRLPWTLRNWIPGLSTSDTRQYPFRCPTLPSGYPGSILIKRVGLT